MIKYVFIIIIAVIALLLTYSSKKIAKYIFKKEEPEQKDILKIKLFALLLGIIDFVLALILL